MIRLQRILFPTDFSECSKRAQEYACELADRFSAELHVLNVLQDVTLMMPEPGSAPMLHRNYLLEMKEGAEKALDALLPAAWTEGKRAVRATRMGNPFIEIGKYAKEKEIDLIVLGTHGRSAIMHVLLGNVAERVVRSAPCPVLTVRPEAHQFVMP
jgi:nucleotide-binding universal stress UspA family protein